VVVLGLVLALGLPALSIEAEAQTEAVCSPAPCHRPDARIRLNNQPVSVGDDIYNLDSLGQTRVALVRREGVAQFYVRLENESSDVDDLVVQGTRNTTYFGIRYFYGDQEISARVRAGVQRFVDVASGGWRTVRMEIRAEASAPVRSRVVARLTVGSGADPTALDRVKAVVYRSRGVETPIEGRTWTNRETAQRWAHNHNATARFVLNADLYWDLAETRGIRPEVAYAQSAKETAYGHFGGVIDATWNNPCGLKTTQGGDNDDPDAHQRFMNWRQGVTACLDHLALYAGAPGYPRDQTPDPRHFSSIYATAPTVERLGGHWAPALDYGTSIVNDYLNPLLGS
jgi:Mannosyl-glycoprotein endo-beta-N-acetylglucosaminidase